MYSENRFHPHYVRNIACILETTFFPNLQSPFLIVEVVLIFIINMGRIKMKKYVYILQMSSKEIQEIVLLNMTEPLIIL